MTREYNIVNKVLADEEKDDEFVLALPAILDALDPGEVLALLQPMLPAVVARLRELAASDRGWAKDLLDKYAMEIRRALGD